MDHSAPASASGTAAGQGQSLIRTGRLHAARCTVQEDKTRIVIEQALADIYPSSKGEHHQSSPLPLGLPTYRERGGPR